MKKTMFQNNDEPSMLNPQYKYFLIVLICTCIAIISVILICSNLTFLKPTILLNIYKIYNTIYEADCGKFQDHG